MQRLIATVSNYSLDGFLADQDTAFLDVLLRGERRSDDVPGSRRLDLVSSTVASNGILELQYARRR